MVEEVDRSEARLERRGMGDAGGHEVLVAAPARSRGLVDRQMHLPFDDDPPLGTVTVFRHRRILSRLEQRRRSRPSLQQPQGHPTEGRVRFRQLPNELRESRHGGGIRSRGLKLAAGKGYDRTEWTSSVVAPGWNPSDVRLQDIMTRTWCPSTRTRASIALRSSWPKTGPGGCSSPRTGSSWE